MTNHLEQDFCNPSISRLLGVCVPQVLKEQLRTVLGMSLLCEIATMGRWKSSALR